MAWVLLDDNFPNHPKVIQVGPVAAWLYVCGVAYCRRHHTGGFVPTRAVKTLGVTTNPRRLIDALLEANLWQKTDTGFQIHDYAVIYPDDAGDKAEKELRRKQKQEAGRRGGLASWQRRHGARSAEAPAEANAEAPAEAESKQPAEAHRVGLVQEVRKEKKEASAERRSQPPFDQWFLAFKLAYPAKGRTDGPMAMQAFLDVFALDQRDPAVLWAEIQASEAGYARSDAVRAGKVKNMTAWLTEGYYAQQHDVPPAAAPAPDPYRDLIRERAAAQRVVNG